MGAGTEGTRRVRGLQLKQLQCALQAISCTRHAGSNKCTTLALQPTLRAHVTYCQYSVQLCSLFAWWFAGVHGPMDSVNKQHTEFIVTAAVGHVC